MKKLMKKKVSLFGKEFSVLAIAVVAMMAFASAALVPYISNTITGDVTLTSPIILSVGAGDDIATETWASQDNSVPADSALSTNSFTGLTGVGGLTERLWIKMDNEANTYTDTRYLVIEITNTQGISKQEVEAMIKNIIAYDWAHESMHVTGEQITEDVPYTVSDPVGNTVRVSAPVWLWADGEDGDVVYAEVDFGFPLNSHGTYSIEAAVLIDDTVSFDSTGVNPVTIA